MKRTIILAAFAATASIALVNGVQAASALNLSTEELKTCLLLELAEKGACVRYEHRLVREVAASASTNPEAVLRGAIERPVAESLTQ